MRYDAYLFDLYGTLVDIRTDEDRPSLWRETAKLYAKNGAVYAPEELHARYRAACAAESAAHPDPDYEISIGRVFAALYRNRGVAPSDALIAETARRFRAASCARLRLYAGALPLLEALRARGRVILLSNAQRLFTEPELKTLGLEDAFDAIYLSSDYAVKKPSPAFFALPLRDFGLLPERCIMIGNDPVCDVAGANRAGMDALFIRTAISPADASVPCIGARYSLPRMNLARVLQILTKEERA